MTEEQREYIRKSNIAAIDDNQSFFEQFRFLRKQLLFLPVIHGNLLLCRFCRCYSRGCGCTCCCCWPWKNCRSVSRWWHRICRTKSTLESAHFAIILVIFLLRSSLFFCLLTFLLPLGTCGLRLIIYKMFNDSVMVTYLSDDDLLFFIFKFFYLTYRILGSIVRIYKCNVVGCTS